MIDRFMPTHVPMPAWTDEELLTLVEFQRRNGHRWKSKLLGSTCSARTTANRMAPRCAGYAIAKGQAGSTLCARPRSTRPKRGLLRPRTAANNPPCTPTRILHLSRHDFENGPARVSIGWDAPLASFFLQVWTGKEKDQDEGPSIWLGAYYGEAPSPAPLIAVARRHVPDLPATLYRQLTIDQLAAPARPRRPGLIDPSR